MTNGVNQLYLINCFKSCFCYREPRGSKIQCRAVLSLLKSLSIRSLREVLSWSVFFVLDVVCRKQERFVEHSDRHVIHGKTDDHYLDWRLPEQEWQGALQCMDMFTHGFGKRKTLVIREMWALFREQFAYDDDSGNVRKGDHTTAWLCRVPTGDELVVVRSLRGFDIRGSLEALRSFGIDVDQYLLRGSLPFIFGVFYFAVDW